jgi:hypothetical protein
MKVYKLDKSLDGFNNDLNNGIKNIRRLCFQMSKSIKLINLFV